MISKKRGLGRGLGALIPQGIEEGKLEGELRKININQVIPNPAQPRISIDNEKLQELVESIKEHGVVQPVLVRPVDDKYELIAGERRFRACKQLGMENIPALIKDYNDFESSVVALIENIQRENLNPVEEAQGYSRLMSEYGLTQEDISRRLGKSRPFIANMVRLLNLPDEVKEMIKDGTLTAGHARALVALKDRDTQLLYALKIVRRHLNVRQTEEMIRKQFEVAENKDNCNVIKDEEVSSLEELLSNNFGTKVVIKKGKTGRGKIIINFNNLEEYKNLLDKLNYKIVSRETI